jgi:NADH-quinone oxidoreductase subunit A
LRVRTPLSSRRVDGKEKENMTRRYTEYAPVRVYRVVSRVLAIVVRSRSMLVSTQAGDAEKLSAYECGFNPFDDARSRFDIRFYLVAIRFILFDLEASFRFPWAVSMGEQTSFGFRTMRDFVRELVVGYVYAWKIGALEWE